MGETRIPQDPATRRWIQGAGIQALCLLLGAPMHEMSLMVKWSCALLSLARAACSSLLLGCAICASLAPPGTAASVHAFSAGPAVASCLLAQQPW